ncbi:unnamed protein product, partial [Rodentolepis nana]
MVGFRGVNFELMGIADKTEGMHVFYHFRVILERGKHHTVGKVIHKTLGVVIHASTQENAINERLYSTVDVSAAENIGRIL